MYCRPAPQLGERSSCTVAASPVVSTWPKAPTISLAAPYDASMLAGSCARTPAPVPHSAPAAASAAPRRPMHCPLPRTYAPGSERHAEVQRQLAELEIEVGAA